MRNAGLEVLKLGLLATALAAACGSSDPMAMTALPDGSVLMAGGLQHNNGSADRYLASAELFHPGTHTSELVACMTTDRITHTATLLADGRVLVAGGQGVATAEIYR